MNGSRCRISVLSTLRHLLRAWWQVDRIRVSPRDGLLLRLRPPCYLEYHDVLWLVESRSVGTGIRGDYVSYRCSCDTHLGILTVFPNRKGQEQVSWVVDQEITDAVAEDFQVYSPLDEKYRTSRELC